jgi:glycerate kinase
MQVLIAPEKFKPAFQPPKPPTLWQRAGARGWPLDKPLEMECLPVADGGGGTAEAIRDALAGRWVTLAVHDPLD